jgi:hypothetical protein
MPAGDPFSIAVTSTAPTDSNDTEIFNSVTAFGRGVFRTLGIKRLAFSAEHSHAATLKLYMSTNHGTNWDQVEGDETMGVPASGDIGGPIDWYVGTYVDVRIVWTNGGTTQTTWRPNLLASYDAQPGT